MSFIKEIIFLLLLILSFSCQTRLEKQGWQGLAIVSQVDTSTIKKDKELVVLKKYAGKRLYYYEFYVSEKDSTGKIDSREWSKGFYLNSDKAYYKWESDSLFVKLLNQGNIQASIKLSYTDGRNTLDILYERKK